MIKATTTLPPHFYIPQGRILGLFVNDMLYSSYFKRCVSLDFVHPLFLSQVASNDSASFPPLFEIFSPSMSSTCRISISHTYDVVWLDSDSHIDLTHVRFPKIQTTFLLFLRASLLDLALSMALTTLTTSLSPRSIARLILDFACIIISHPTLLSSVDPCAGSANTITILCCSTNLNSCEFPCPDAPLYLILWTRE